MAWQPDGWNDDMSEAPKDGTRILVHVRAYGAMTAHCEMFGPTAGRKFHLHACLNKDAQPTNWRYLPSPPSKQED